ncbi:MAG: SurA N-terminal domain-containing protein [Verrucomicrobiota bacterium]
MMKFLRSQSQTVLVVVLGVIAIGFLFYGNAGNLITQGSGRASNDYGRIDGQDLTVSDLYDAVRSARNAVILAGQESVLRQPGGSAALAERAWQDLLLQREADKLHVYVTDQQVADWIRKQPLFQKDGAFDLNTYNTQIKALQTILHISTDGAVDPAANTQAVFESFVRNNLRMDAVKGALLDTVRSPAGDIEVQYQKIAGPATISYVVIDPKDYETRVQVTPGDIEAEYKDHPENPDYRTKERRKVDYVLFLLTPEQAKLPDDQKRAAKDALGQKALDFALAFQPNPSAGDGAAPAPAPPDFNAEAEKRGLTPGTTDFFTDDSPPAGVPPSPAFNRAAFSLTKDNTVSRVVELDNGVAVLHLGEIQASALRPLAEVKAGIQKHLLQTHAAQAAQVAAGIDAKVLQATVSGGADFKTAATA